MELNLKYEELWDLIMKLPSNELARLKADLISPSKSIKMPTRRTNFQKLLLEGPTMTDEQFEQFKEIREYSNAWKTN